MKVLLVDDEPFIRQGLRIMLDWEMYGYEIAAEAENGIEAVKILEGQEIDLAIVDLNMPGMSGLAFIEYVRKNISDHVRFVILTGYADFEYAKMALRLNVEDYILKPVKKEELILILERLNKDYRYEEEKKSHEKIQERMEYNVHIANVIFGKYTRENLLYVKKRLISADKWQYISFEFDVQHKSFAVLSKAEKAELQISCMEYLSKIIKENPFHVVQLLEQETHIFGIALLFTPELALHNQMEDKEYIAFLQCHLSQHFLCGIQVYIGSETDSIERISESYHSVSIARCLHNFADEKKTITFYEELENRKTDSGLGQIEIEPLIACVKDNKTDRIQKEVETIYHKICKNATILERINANIYYMLYRLIELAKEFDNEENQEEVLKYISRESFDKIALSGSVEELKRFVLHYAEYLEQLRSTQTKGTLEKIEDYIQENYRENISLRSLGEKFYINNVYLGQLFKKKYGMFFSDYLNELRIKEAVKLLETTELRVYAIAEKVGFHNADYFINKFVQLKGITPHQYRIKNVWFE